MVIHESQRSSNDTSSAARDAQLRKKPHDCNGIFPARRSIKSPSRNPGRMMKLIHNVIRTDVATCSTGGAPAAKCSRPSDATSTGRNTPIPYTPSPSQAHGMPQRTTLEKLRRMKAGVLSDASAASAADDGTALCMMRTSEPNRLFTAFWASALRPCSSSHCGLCTKPMRDTSIAAATAATIHMSFGQCCGASPPLSTP